MADIPYSKRYQLLLSVRDKNLRVATISQYHLSIYVSDTHFKVSCVHPITTQCLLLEVYKLAYQNPYQRVQAIEQLYQDHPLLGTGTWSAVTLCIGNQQYTLIPRAFAQEQRLTNYLNFSCPIGSNTIRHYAHTSLNMTVGFAIDTWLFNWFKLTYAPTRLHTIHQASSLIQGSWTYVRGSKPSLLSKMLVFVEPNYLHTTVIHKNDVLYYNRFEYTDSNALLYYILVVMHTLQLNTNLHEVVLGGHIKKSAPAYRKAGNYIRKLTLSGAPTHLKFGNVFTKEMMTTHADVLGIHLCYPG